jgi:hypothetical protein
MLRDLNFNKFHSVTKISKDILEKTVETDNLPIDVEAIAETYGLFVDELRELSELSGEIREHKLFQLSMKIIEHEYVLQHNEELEKVYISLGARYLMMPEKGFRENILSYNYNLFDLKKEIYTNVPLESLAYHLADVERCVVCRWSEGSYVKSFINHGMDDPQTTSLRFYTDQVVRVLQRNLKGMHEVEIGDSLKITGWRMGIKNIMLVCLQNDSVYLQR